MKEQSMLLMALQLMFPKDQKDYAMSILNEKDRLHFSGKHNLFGQIEDGRPISVYTLPLKTANEGCLKIAIDYYEGVKVMCVSLLKQFIQEHEGSQHNEFLQKLDTIDDNTALFVMLYW